MQSGGVVEGDSGDGAFEVGSNFADVSDNLADVFHSLGEAVESFVGLGDVGIVFLLVVALHVGHEFERLGESFQALVQVHG